MSTTFNFPANPAVGDTVVLPSGATAQWNGTEWVSLADSSATITYPLPVTQGGTGAAAAPAARVNLGINTATGELIVTKDGTALLPGLAFASEPGLGWYRTGASTIATATQGNVITYVGGNLASATSMALMPRANGLSQINFWNQAFGSANYNYLNIKQNADGSAGIGTAVIGTATRGNLTLDAPVVGITGGQIQFPAVAIPSNDPNTLDDYREGTWTPTNSAGVQMTINTAYYRKVGSLVWIHAFITFAANSSGASMQFGGLPFPANYFGAIPVAYQNWSPAPAGQLTTMASGSLLSVYMGGGFATFANASGGQIYISGVYAT